MSHADWEDVVDSPEELDDETAESLLEGAAAVQDMTGEVCPYPQIEAKKAIQRLESGDLLVQETDHVPSTENVPKSVEGEAEAQVWRSGDGLYRIFLRKA
ncbi:sulfurtransferase TusA family protein (plasmid) [Halolamina sp. CBA1230]|uniref:sulfurtransferase TusA family protein n=1 Tax=Halolamina sp. CBA1230 TaxID=1853690 RepID=UPI0009A1AE55|nr:sulfurtransferase TusA family protein [Halolamina sp. CBA1230]QKY21926.1 sulfurtransferase TusA family protein [Halolamina sp. CBA1230]